jgi:hypothetical protein
VFGAIRSHAVLVALAKPSGVVTFSATAAVLRAQLLGFAILSVSIVGRPAFVARHALIAFITKAGTRASITVAVLWARAVVLLHRASELS